MIDVLLGAVYPYGLVLLLVPSLLMLRGRTRGLIAGGLAVILIGGMLSLPLPFLLGLRGFLEFVVGLGLVAISLLAGLTMMVFGVSAATRDADVLDEVAAPNR